MKIILKENHLYNTGLGLLMALNYAFEGFLMYGVYLLVNHWYVTGNEMVLWIIGALFLMFIRLVVTADEFSGEHVRARRFNFHLLQLWRLGLTMVYIIKKIPLSVEVRSEDQ